jgi:hypothetical protein
MVCIMDINAVFRGGAQGQDFDYHRDRMLQAAQHPFGFARTFSATDPPLYYLFAALLYHVAGAGHWLYAVGLMNVVFNVAGLFILYLIAKFLIRKRILRICLVCFVGFLPAFAITSVVFAGDAFSQLPCLLTIYFAALAVFHKISPRKALILCTIATVFAISTKFIALALFVSFCGVITLMVISHHLTLRSAIRASLFYFFMTVPIAVLFVSGRPRTPELYVSTANPEMLRLPWASIPLRSAVFFRSDDLQLLDAPSHWQLVRTPKFPSPSFCNGNSYSYPGLLCFGIFTDLLNFFQSKGGLNPEASEPSFMGALVGIRSDANQELMVIAVRCGSIPFICIMFSLPVLFLDSVRVVLKRRSRRHLIWLFGFLVGAPWLAFMVCVMPLVTNPYTFGYYLPRLVLPSIMIFAMLFFAGIERLAFFRRDSVCGILLCLIAIQSVIHVSFLWMG